MDLFYEQTGYPFFKYYIRDNLPLNVPTKYNPIFFTPDPGAALKAKKQFYLGTSKIIVFNGRLLTSDSWYPKDTADLWPQLQSENKSVLYLLNYFLIEFTRLRSSSKHCFWKQFLEIRSGPRVFPNVLESHFAAHHSSMCSYKEPLYKRIEDLGGFSRSLMGIYLNMAFHELPHPLNQYRSGSSSTARAFLYFHITLGFPHWNLSSQLSLYQVVFPDEGSLSPSDNDFLVVIKQISAS